MGVPLRSLWQGGGCTLGEAIGPLFFVPSELKNPPGYSLMPVISRKGRE